MNSAVRSSSSQLSRSISCPLSRALAAQKRHASHGTDYNEPSGHIFGEKPPLPGQKRKKEDWEYIWYWGMFGSLALASVGLYYKPDTSISQWALHEAKQRMEARGEPTEYRPS
ncbi:Ndufb11, NADH dehydrogenase 1 beta subcomplex subunit [Cantharellus anzutake]|uniref:Ndufb11, NADH dehydrogenase 1 beta subcomplex subunit n=1 Tax=Cantharellus anzutake TaxID=1750568 RepID=UPI001905979E|nr:Ndufb11, NADH dehydrogenase 1 beta subcomplex subunit [Cantharellus anzutake]KAF8328219.1 Ndufb11, NADH dehydrogenase 1 beta subcomplex subunit [Cantharellus anzutake]